MKQITLFLQFIMLSNLIVGCFAPATQPVPAVATATTVLAITSLTNTPIQEVTPLTMPTETPTTPPETPLEIPPPSPTETPTTSLQTSPDQVLNLDLTETYEDTVVGFALDYPASWTLQGVLEETRAQAHIYSAVLMSWQPNELEAGPPHGIPEGSNKMDISVAKSAPDTLEETLPRWKGQTPILSQQTVTLPSGLIGVYIVFEMPPNQPQAGLFVTNINNHTVVLSGLGDLKVFQSIARTLRAL